MIEEKMKRLLSFPPSLPLPPPDYMLKHVFWLRNDAKLIAYIKVTHVKNINTILYIDSELLLQGFRH